MRDALRCSASRCWRLPPARKPTIRGYQGWVEADLIFVSPDEAGRVETLSVREGDTVEKGAPLFTVDPRPAAGRRRDGEGGGDQRHPGLRARADAAQDLGRHAEDGRGRGSDAAHRAGAAHLGADPPGAPQGGKPGDRLGAADLLPAGRDGAGRTAGGVAAAAGQHQDPLLRAGDGAAEASRSATP